MSREGYICQPFRQHKAAGATARPPPTLAFAAPLLLVLAAEVLPQDGLHPVVCSELVQCPHEVEAVRLRGRHPQQLQQDLHRLRGQGRPLAEQFELKTLIWFIL